MTLVTVNASLVASTHLLIEELNAHAASGLITHRALVLINVVQRELAGVKKTEGNNDGSSERKQLDT